VRSRDACEKSLAQLPLANGPVSSGNPEMLTLPKRLVIGSSM
jgi:hypothetical protein